MEEPKIYQGSEPYVAASFAPEERELVLPILSWLSDDGCRIWYNDMPPQEALAEKIAQRIRASGCLIAFLSRAYLSNEALCDEVIFARRERCSVLLIYLEPVELNPGMALRLGRFPSVHLYAYSNVLDFFRRLEELPVLAPFRNKI